MVQPTPRQVPIAVVGVSALMPGSTDSTGFWRDVLRGRDLITDVPATRWLVEDYYDPDPFTPDKTYCRRGAFLDEVDFDSLAYGVPPKALESTDSSQLLALLAADAVLADAGRGTTTPLDPDRVGVILGVAQLQLGGEMAQRVAWPLLVKVLRELGMPETQVKETCDRMLEHVVPWQESTFPGMLGNVVAGRIANRFDLHGTNFTTDAACASSLAALSMAVDELALGRADLMLTGGVDTLNDIFSFMCFSKTPALSLTGDCRPFSDAADGTMLGEGLVMFALKRLADAEACGDRIYAVITGIGSSSDGKGTSIYAPVAAGQARALRRAYAAAGYTPATVELVEAHGTGTAVGDIAEFQALREVFDATGRTDRQWCALGSVKSQYGHTKTTAGAVGLLKAVLALHHKVLPPTIKVQRPDPRLSLATSPLYLNTVSRPWIAAADHPRRAGVSSFGFGGTNFHVTVEEYQPDRGGRSAWRTRTVPDELVLLSARTPAALAERCRGMTSGRSLAELARQSQRDFDPDQPARLALVADSFADLQEKLDRTVARLAESSDTAFTSPAGIYYSTGPANVGRVAFLFPGQGSQYVGMGADLAMHLSQAQAVWDRCAPTAPGLAGVVFPIPVFTDADRAVQSETLMATEWAQPALAMHSLVLLELLRGLGLTPDCVAGHSTGELVALHAAGIYGDRALLRLARRRGELIRDAATVPGAMLAVRADERTVSSLLGEQTWLANHNGPAEYVVSGTRQAIAELEARLAAEGLTGRRLNTATGFHSPLVEQACSPLAEYLDCVVIDQPMIEVYGNADGAPYPADPAQIRRRIAEQPASMVRWTETIQALYAAGVRTFIEVGAGSTLTGLVSRILADNEHRAICTDRRGAPGLTSLHRALGELSAYGFRLDLDPLWDGQAPPQEETDDTANRPKMITKISGRNLSVSYPPTGGATALPPPNPDRAPEPSPPPPRRQSEADEGWAQLIREAQQQTADSHASYQHAMADSHKAYLRASEATMQTLLASLSAGGAQEISSLATPINVPLPVPPPAEVLGGIGSPGNPAVPASPSSIVLTAAEVEALVRSVIADKTGYPPDMIDMDMDIDVDLGIDSIKRVEILAALQQELPQLPDLSQATSDQLVELMKIRTVREVTERSITAIAALGQHPPPGPPALAASATALGRLAIRTQPAPPCGPAMSALGLAPLAVLDGGSEVVPAVVRRLTERGVNAQIVTSVPAGARSVLFLGGLSEVATVEEAIAIQRAAFRAAREVAAGMTAEGGVFVTVQDTGGDFGLRGAHPDRAWLGGLSALARTMALEWPTAHIKAIDCEQAGRAPEAIADAIVAELLGGGPATVVGLRTDGRRLTLTEVLAPAPTDLDPTLVLGAAPTIVVTGGARGVTAEAARTLALSCRARLVLVGRTPATDGPDGYEAAADEVTLTRLLAKSTPESTPGSLRAQARALLAAREVRRNLAALHEAGVTARYLCLDVTDGVALTEALAEVRRDWGPITGVIHGAGVLADKLIADKTDQDFDAVFNTKVAGLRALLAATEDDPLRLLCAFSSVAAQFGNIGQCDYAMANETLNQVLSAQAVRRPRCAVRALLWGPWRGGMVGDGLAGLFGQAGISLIDPAEGGRALLAEISAGGIDTRILLAPPQTLEILARRAKPTASVDDRSHPRLAGMQAVPFSDPLPQS